jgi:hypothetical protein
MCVCGATNGGDDGYAAFIMLSCSLLISHFLLKLSPGLRFSGRHWLESIQGVPKSHSSLHAPPPCVRAYYFPELWPQLGGSIPLHAFTH